MARRQKITACEAKALLKDQGVDLAHRDYFDLSGHEVGLVLDAAKKVGYRKGRSMNAQSKSTGRAFVDFLRRKKGCRP